ncbi:homoserine dehydrogenase [Methanobrevibacter arboriphilus JCM 13429 = DSM 1125]|uniref:Homoserine dehydrogenase n=1 Tax=Methanobrevibacter arboriphilus JCM 13429 = DSM 1125 TaxID=1300164 RepID=A0A1V6N0V9_METAZ|nr:homoserine dehydrogenase [Methanobrevibacter arboriphilus]OQD58321.1 homoserine dehydrogenase [Methanobrevibacter arboriphilus JCM 13429 = DSM 1125]
MSKSEINIGLIGFGTIGAGVVEIFNKNQDILSKKCGKPVHLRKVADLDITTDRGVKIDESILTTDVNDVLENDDIDIVIELVGGYEPAKTFVLKAMENGKHVVSANKALIAKHWEELISTADENNVRFSFEASVGGGIPVLQPLNECLSANRFEAIYGIMNGTANYILTKMSEEGLKFEDVLKEAQDKGYAEADPTFDIEGHDTAQKLIVLTKLGFGEYVPQEKFHVEGITKITPEDIEFAKNELDYVIKLLGIAKQTNDGLEIRVHPTFIKKDHLLASVNDVFNAIYLIGDFVGPVMLYGQGAGRMATASAVVGDCLDIIFNESKRISYGPVESQVKSMKNIDDVVSKYYISLTTVDEPGVLQTITGTLNKNGISIESITQKTNIDSESVPIIIVTHETEEKNIQQAIQKINELKEVEGESKLIRILE